jgi:hypothetical protein
MVHLTFSAIVTSFSLTIIKDRNAFFNCPARIEALSVAFPVSILNLAKAVDRFSAVCSASAKSLP